MSGSISTPLPPFVRPLCRADLAGMNAHANGSNQEPVCGPIARLSGDNIFYLEIRERQVERVPGEATTGAF